MNKELGITLGVKEIEEYFKRMMHSPEIMGEDELEITVSDVRSDVLHKCDLIEDIAIAYGYNNFMRILPDFSTIGAENPLNKFSEKIRVECGLSGYTEVLTPSLLSSKDNIFPEHGCVTLMNPQSSECEVVRTSLLPGILKSIHSNQHLGVPMKIFEVSDVVIIEDRDVMPKNLRNLCAAYVGKTSGFEEVQGLLSLILEKCGLKQRYAYEASEAKGKYFEGRAALVKIDNTIIGTLGVIHPQVCLDFRIPFACSSFEIDLEKLFEIYLNYK